MKLITISGLDGSGKSTQTEMLKNELKRKGSKVFYFHAIQFSLANKIAELFRSQKTEEKKEEKSVTTAMPLQILLRKIFLQIDIWRFERLRNQLRNSGYDYILSDRYFYDSIINIAYLENKDYSATVLAPDIAIYLRISPEEIMKRERMPDQGVEYLKKKKDLYDAKTDKWNWKIIDGNRDKDIIFEEIKNLIN